MSYQIPEDEIPDPAEECWLYGGPGEPSDWCGEHGAAANRIDPRDPEMVVCRVRLSYLERTCPEE